MESNSQQAAWRNNLGILTGVAGVTFIAARLISVAGGNLETAYAILQLEGTGGVIVGSLASSIGIIAAPVGFALTLVGRNRVNKDRTPAMTAVLSTGFALLVLAMFAAPIAKLLGSVLVSLICVAIISWKRWWNDRSLVLTPGMRSKQARFRVNWREAAVIYAVFTGLFAVASQNPWIPVENITVRSHREFSAYILSENSKTTYILTFQPTEVIQLPSVSITGTSYCTSAGYLTADSTFMDSTSSFTEWLVPTGPMVAKYPLCKRGFFQTKPTTTSRP